MGSGGGTGPEWGRGSEWEGSGLGMGPEWEGSENELCSIEATLSVHLRMGYVAADLAGV